MRRDSLLSLTTYYDDINHLSISDMGCVTIQSDNVNDIEMGCLTISTDTDKYGGLNTPEERAAMSKWVLWVCHIYE